MALQEKFLKKERTDLFTEIDLKNEETIKKYLLKKYPKFAFLGEESNNFEDKDFSWIVDPINGTSNFISWLSFLLRFNRFGL